jgi:glycerol-1-phosphatase
VRARLPHGRFPPRFHRAPNLLALADEFDVFLLDAYGVLNVGRAPVPGAPEAVAALAARGKRLLVLTNGATYDAQQSLATYRSYGFGLERHQVVSSRDLLASALTAYPTETVWGIAAPAHACLERLPARVARLADDPLPYVAADGFVLLSSSGWTDARQARLVAAVRARPRPVLVANPDLVAPREDGFSVEPGFYAHALGDLTGIALQFFGKPYANAFDEARRRLAQQGVAVTDPARVVMVGDTLHTDVLGGAAAGFRTALVTGHGLFRSLDPRPYIARSGIVPDYVVDTA